MSTQDLYCDSGLYASLKPGDHMCCIYETEAEHRAVITPYIQLGLERGEKVIYIVDLHTAATVLGYLRDQGIDADAYIAREQLVMATHEETYLRDGIFDPDAMIVFLRATMQQALADGYAALRVTGEMTWALRGLPGSERLIEYEAKLNLFFPGSQCSAVCQYNRQRFDPAILLDVVHTHPTVIIGTQCYDNFYFIPPEAFLSNLPAARLQQWLQSLQNSKLAQTALRQSESFLKQTQEITQVGGWEYEAETKKVIWTDEVYRIYEVDQNYNPSDIHQAVEFYAPQDQEIIDQAFQQAVELGNSYDLELKFIAASGKQKWVRTCGQAERKAGKIVRVFGNIMDITKSRQAQEALRSSEERFRVTQELSLDAFTILTAVRDSQRHIVDFEWAFANAEAGRILRQPSEDLIGKRLLQILPGNLGNQALFERYVQIVEGGQGNEIELEYNSEGISGWFRNMAIKLGDGVAVSFSDITHRKRIAAAEHEQRVLAEAMRDTSAALNSALKVDDVLDRILEIIGRVMSLNTDAILILLLDDAYKIARIVRYHSVRFPDHGAKISSLQFPISQTHNLLEVQTTDSPVFIADTRTYPGWLNTPPIDWIRSNLSVPVKIKGRIIGFLNLASATPNAFTPLNADHLRAFASQAAIAIENAQLYEELQDLALTDALTGMVNRRGLLQLGEREVERAVRFQHPLAVVMLDIDFFKRVNDTYGHATGDRVLHALAEVCRTEVRKVDILARYGGEEFILLLPETDLDSAMQVAERLRQSVEEMVVLAEGDESIAGSPVHVTVSLGIVMLSPDTPDLATLLARVDQALYAAKEQGRNCTVLGI
jgi:diguanylate cyclase (GGDEF)-like protein